MHSLCPCFNAYALTVSLLQCLCTPCVPASMLMHSLCPCFNAYALTVSLLQCLCTPCVPASMLMHSLCPCFNAYALTVSPLQRAVCCWQASAPWICWSPSLSHCLRSCGSEPSPFGKTSSTCTPPGAVLERSDRYRRQRLSTRCHIIVAEGPRKQLDNLLFLQDYLIFVRDLMMVLPFLTLFLHAKQETIRNSAADTQDIVRSLFVSVADIFHCWFSSQVLRAYFRLDRQGALVFNLFPLFSPPSTFVVSSRAVRRL